MNYCNRIVSEDGRPVKVMHNGVISTVLVCNREATEDGRCDQHQVISREAGWCAPAGTSGLTRVARNDWEIIADEPGQTTLRGGIRYPG